MAGIIFNEGAMTPVTRGINRRRFIAAASGAMASLATHSAFARQAEATPPDGSGKLEKIGVGGPERLKDLLSLVPNNLLSPDDGYGVPFSYADLAQQFVSVGIEQNVAGDDPLGQDQLRARSPLAAASPAFQRSTDVEFTNAIGFQPLETGQTLQAGAPADQLTLFQGGMDLDELPKAWKASGYELARTDDDIEIWTIGKNGEIDLEESPMGAYVFGSFNNVTILDNGVVMFAHRYDRLESAIETASAGTGSMLDDAGISAVVAAMPVDTVSAIALTPEYASPYPVSLGDGATPDLDIEPEAGEEMPAYRSFALGITAGFMNPEFQPTGEGTPDNSVESAEESVIPDGGVIFARLAAAPDEDAGLIAEVVEDRWSKQNSLVTNTPYTEFMSIVEAGAKGEVAAIDFAPLIAPAIWIDLVLQRDLAPFAPST